MVATKGAYQKALDKARALGGARLIVGQRGNVYTVRGSVAPSTYAVTLDADGELHCECPAGAHAIPCHHAAAVKLRQWGEQAAGLLVTLDRKSPVKSGDFGAAAPLQERSGLGVGMARRWADEDDASPLDLLGRTA
jgi:hypothetical protein